MEPSSPVLAPEFQSKEVLFGAGQPEYIPLPALIDPTGMILTRWKLTDEERQAIAKGADIYLTVLTNGHALQPVLLRVLSTDADMLGIAVEMGLL